MPDLDRRRLVRLDLDALKKLLQLPASTEIVGVTEYRMSRTLDVTIVDDSFDRVWPGGDPPLMPLRVETTVVVSEPR